MGERVDAERGVIDEDGAPQESDDETRPARNEIAKTGKNYGRQDLNFVQPHQLWVARQIGNLREIRAAQYRNADDDAGASKPTR